jgi:hypothetical protein
MSARCLGHWLFVSASLLIQAPVAAGAQPVKANGLEIFYGVIPAEVILGHPADHEERKMHGGPPTGPGQHHLIVSLFDARTGQRVTDAKIVGTVSERGLAPQRKPLESMTFAGTITYGNYFRMPPPGPYRIEVEIRRSGSTGPVKTSFEYSHPRR